MKTINKNLCVGGIALLTYTIGLFLMLHAFEVQIEQRMPYAAGGFILFIVSLVFLAEFFKRRLFEENKIKNI